MSSIAAATSPQPAVQTSLTLCVDLDGTLIRTDLLWECLISLLKTQPLSLFLLPVWLLGGRANLKLQLAKRVRLDVANLPYRNEVVEFLRAEKSQGRRLALVSACTTELAGQVARHLGLFDEVFASDQQQNLKGKRKAALLGDRFGLHGFEYLGDSPADLSVWQSANGAYVVGSERLAGKAARLATVKRVFPVKQATFATWVSAVRGHHWFKNSLLFLPLALAHKFDLHNWVMAGVGFILFGLCASGVYVLNDLLDLHSDREHPWKRQRPFAAGDVSIPTGLLMCSVLLLISLPGSFLLNPRFGVVLVFYLVLTMWYSLHLKRLALVDVFVLSGFYSTRIFAGSVITSTLLSQWFLSFSLFFFLSLAMAKRYSELVHASELVERGQSGRGYIGKDRDVLMNLGIASGFSAVVIFSLYVHSPDLAPLYPNPRPLLLIAPIVAFWLSRVWLKANRGELHEDPVTLALRDPLSYVVAVAAVLIFALAMVKAH
ncbi:MAG: UbiA family prenyltransferase [Candidatus Angelobacter sp. Gp1-AA117]|nr:MAG: UbiA family prenyltransferase [Candidatus Angelobacter sp. Gp1-AA117]